MAINDIVQTIAEARVDARSLSEFMFKPAGFKVARRLAPTIDTLQFYINRFDATKATTDAYVATIPTIVNDAINNTAVEGGILADTFVTMTSKAKGAVPRTLREINGDSVNIKDFGAICDGTLHTIAEWTVVGSRIYYPDLAAIQAVYPHVESLEDSVDWVAAQQALNLRGHAVASGYTVVFNRTLTLGQNQSFIGGNGANRVPVKVTHSDVVFQLAAKATLRNFEITPIGDKYLYTGVSIDSKTVASASYNTVHNVKCFFPKIGFLLIGEAYWNILTEIDCYFFKEYGILLGGEGLGNEAGCNNNYIRFMSLSSNAQLTQIPGGYKYTYDDVTWEQAAIKVKFGHQNTFVGGEPAPSKYGVIVEARMGGNRFENMYMEHQKIPLKTGPNSVTFWDSSMSMGTPDIHIDSVVIGPSGLNNSLHTRINTAPLAGARNLKAAWYFNEGTGNKVYDFSGNRKHLTLVNPNWTNEGRWGSTARLKADITSRINPIPIDTVDWTKPFTFAACVKIADEIKDNFVLSFRGGNGKYGSVTVASDIWSYIDYNGTTAETTSGGKMLRSSQDGHSWVVLHFDPDTKTLTSINPIGSSNPVTFPKAPRFSVWPQGGGAGVVEVSLGFNSPRGFDGCFSFVGFWDRKLTLAEVTDLVNMKIPTLFPAAAPIRVESQEDSIAEDVLTLKEDFNALLTKLKSSGLMD